MKIAYIEKQVEELAEMPENNSHSTEVQAEQEGNIRVLLEREFEQNSMHSAEEPADPKGSN